MNAEVCKTALCIGKLGRDRYSSDSNYPIRGAQYKDYKSIAVNMLLRGVLQDRLHDLSKPICHFSENMDKMIIVGYEPLKNPFKKYKHWVLFLNELGVSTNLKAVANNRREGRKFLPLSVPRVPSTEAFLLQAQQKLFSQFKIRLDPDQILVPIK